MRCGVLLCSLQIAGMTFADDDLMNDVTEAVNFECCAVFTGECSTFSKVANRDASRIIRGLTISGDVKVLTILTCYSQYIAQVANSIVLCPVRFLAIRSDVKPRYTPRGQSESF